MSRLSDSILTGAYQTGSPRPMLDLKNGGQHGWSPQLDAWTSNQAHTSRPLICLMLEVPRMFTVMPDSQKWVSSLKALFEQHARSIEGMSAGLKVDTDEHAVGGAGEQQEEIINVTRERSAPRFSFVEKYGRPIQTLLDYWIRYGMMDPESKFALLSTRGNSNVRDLLADWYSATCIFIQPDPLHQTVDKAWLTTNMFPKGNGDITGKRDLTSGQEILNLDIEFAGISQVGAGVNRFAQELLTSINTRNADPLMKTAFVNKVAADVARETVSSYKGGLEAQARDSVTKF